MLNKTFNKYLLVSLIYTLLSSSTPSFAMVGYLSSPTTDPTTDHDESVGWLRLHFPYILDNNYHIQIGMWGTFSSVVFALGTYGYQTRTTYWRPYVRPHHIPHMLLGFGLVSALTFVILLESPFESLKPMTPEDAVPFQLTSPELQAWNDSVLLIEDARQTLQSELEPLPKTDEKIQYSQNYWDTFFADLKSTEGFVPEKIEDAERAFLKIRSTLTWIVTHLKDRSPEIERE